jgi:LacI family transcriptional regulator
LINSVTRLDHEQEEQLAASGVPVVLLNRDSASRKFSTITGDNAEGGALAAQHLRALGHRAIALLTGPRRHGNLSERAKGFRRVLQNGDLPEPRIIYGKHTFVGGYEMGKQLLTKYRGDTAVFAANDVIAFGCIRAAIELGVRIPEDISIIGFDDVEICQVVSPPLTTIHMPKYEVGRGAIEMLLKRVADKHLQPEHRLLGVRVVERQSCRKIQL